MNHQTDDMPWLESHKRFFLSQQANANLAHGYVITGINGIGKSHLADWLVRAVLCEQPQQVAPCHQCKACHLVEQGHHPDVAILDGQPQRIGVDEVRSLNGKLVTRPQLGRAQVAVILHAERMTVSAANALLKTLEEPSRDTYLLLVTESTSQLLPTIASRVQEVKLSCPKQTQSETWLNSLQLALNPALFEMLKGAPLAYKAFIDAGKAEVFEQFDQSVSLWLNGQSNGLDAGDLLAKEVDAIKWLGYLIHGYQRQHNVLGFAQLSQLQTELSEFVKDRETHPGLNQGLRVQRLIQALDKIWQQRNEHETTSS